MQKDVGLTESHVGQIERGEILISLAALNKIINGTGSSVHYILYGKNLSSRVSTTRRNIDTILDLCTPEEEILFLKWLTAFKRLAK